ncbi:MAG: acetylglutamate kinase [Saprospiraceae bacterium]|jgi:acetylglutamate kinase
MQVNIVKIGGGVIENKEQLAQFLISFSAIEGPKILVHGGGRLATKIATDLGVETKMVEGRRVTDDAMLKVVSMVYGGLTNKTIVAQLQKNGINALGLSGADGNLIKSHKRIHATIDYGWVGDVDKVNTDLLKTLLNSGVVPVLAPLTHDGQGNMLNTNADTIASEVAVALAKSGVDTQLIYGFELQGVLKDFEDKNSVIPQINNESYKKLKNDGIISEGMIPKLDNAFAAISAGVSAVNVCHALQVGKAVHGSAGTKIVK